MSRGLIRWLLMAALFIHIIASSPKAASVKIEDFYKGATMRFVVPWAPGGSYDLWARAVAPQMEKHTGATIVIENMEGAGGLVGGGHLYNSAKPDGLTIGILQGAGMAMGEILGLRGVKYEMANFNYVGRVERMSMMLFTSKASGLRTVQDMQKSEKPIRFIAVDPAGLSAICSALFIEAYGLKGKIICGYKSSKEMKLALTVGKEADAIIISLSLDDIRDVKQGNISVAAQLCRARHDAFPETPTAFEIPGFSPEGRKWIELIAILADSNRMIVAPPRTPHDRVLFLEKALLASLEEPRLKEWAKTQGQEATPLSSAECKALINRLMTEIVPPTERDKIKHIITKKYY